MLEPSYLKVDFARALLCIRLGLGARAHTSSNFLLVLEPHLKIGLGARALRLLGALEPLYPKIGFGARAFVTQDCFWCSSLCISRFVLALEPLRFIRFGLGAQAYTPQVWLGCSSLCISRFVLALEPLCFIRFGLGAQAYTPQVWLGCSSPSIQVRLTYSSLKLAGSARAFVPQG